MGSHITDTHSVYMSILLSQFVPLSHSSKKQTFKVFVTGITGVKHSFPLPIFPPHILSDLLSVSLTPSIFTHELTLLVYSVCHSLNVTGSEVPLEV